MNLLELLIGLAVVAGVILGVVELARARRRLAELEAGQAGLEAKVGALERALRGVESSGAPRAGEVGSVVARSHEPVREAEAGEEAGAGAGSGLVREVLPVLPAMPPVLATTMHARPAAGPGPGSGPGLGFPEEDAGAGTGTGMAPGPEAVAAGGGVGMDWERFMGARLFAWLGGLALFLAVAYFVKYSFDRNLIPPSLRVVMGLAAGLGLVAGGWRLRNAAYAVTGQTFCGTGVVILYASLFAGHAFYGLAWLPSVVAFGAMALVTGMAFVMSVRMGARAVSVLGLLGGFLTPVLLSTGRDQAVALFLYVAVLDLGLVAVAWKRRWEEMVVGAALGTVVMEVGWAASFFEAGKVWGALGVFGGFAVMFTLALAWGVRREAAGGKWGAAVVVVAGAALAFAGWLLGPGGMGDRPGAVFAYVLVADLCLIALACLLERWAPVHTAAGFVAFAYVIAWMATSMAEGQVGWGMGLSLGFAAMHTVLPLVVGRWRGVAWEGGWGGVFPGLAVAGLWVPLLRLDAPGFSVWPGILLLNLLAMGRVARAGGMPGALACVVLSGVAMSMWIGRVPVEATGVGGVVWRMVAMSLVLAAMGGALLARGRWLGGAGTGGDDREVLPVPVVAVLMPFLLLMQIVLFRGVPDASVLFGGLQLVVLVLLAMAAWLRLGMLALLGVAGWALVGHAWWVREGVLTGQPGVVLAWVVGGYGVFAWFPFVARRRLAGDRQGWGWVAGAVAAVPAFHLAYRLVGAAWPNEVMGLVPLAFAVPVGVSFAMEWRRGVGAGEEPGWWLRRLAWLGGVGLFLVTVALPIQFERQWLTLGLALEGAAVLGLFVRVPHPGLRVVGVGLLGAVFVRLLLNPALLEYGVRGSWPIWNQWLYTYGVAVVSMFVGARWLAEPRNRMWGWDVRGILLALGTILGFALVNVQIADFFTPVGERVRFEFTGHFGRDMTYTIAWALFALVLVVTGLRRRLLPCRWAGLGLLAVATGKLFLHDLARLDQLYRVGALMGVALVAIAASMLYQRFAPRDGQAGQM